MKTITLAALLSLNLFAADYSVMSMEQLQAMRGSVPVEDRAAYQAEMQYRLQSMNAEERQAAVATMRQSKSGPLDGSGIQTRSGMGGGSKQFRGGR